MTRFALALGGTRLFNTQSLGLGVLILGFAGSDRDVGLFAIALSLQSLGVAFLQSITNIWAPVVADVHERRDLERLQTLYQTLNRWVGTFSLPILAALIVRPDIFMRILGGRAGAGAATLCAVLAAGNLFFVATGPTSYVLAMTGRAGINTLNSFSAVVLYVVLGLVVVPTHGAIGMAIVDAVVTALVNTIRVVEAKILVGVQPFGWSYAKPAAATLVSAALLLTSRFVFGPGLWIGIAALVVAGVMYLLALWLMGVGAEERYLLDRIKARIMKARA
jgi:O-antigen/teichoic acid export membrane protein